MCEGAGRFLPAAGAVIGSETAAVAVRLAAAVSKTAMIVIRIVVILSKSAPVVV